MASPNRIHWLSSIIGLQCMNGLENAIAYTLFKTCKDKNKMYTFTLEELNGLVNKLSPNSGDIRFIDIYTVFNYLRTVEDNVEMEVKQDKEKANGLFLNYKVLKIEVYR